MYGPTPPPMAQTRSGPDEPEVEPEPRAHERAGSRACADADPSSNATDRLHLAKRGTFADAAAPETTVACLDATLAPVRSQVKESRRAGRVTIQATSAADW